MTALQTLAQWQNFYFMIGGVSGGLIGLMFVAMSLGMRFVRPETAEDMEIFVNPTLFHFTVVLVTACVMLVPAHTVLSLSGLLFGIALVGCWRVMRVWTGAKQKQRQSEEPVEAGHFLWHMGLPLLSYTLTILVAIGLYVLGEGWLLTGIALMVVVLIVCGIHNSWTLVIWIAQQGNR
jgi:hypothetical protein